MLRATEPPAAHKAVDPDAEIAATASRWTQSREPPPTLLAPMLPYQMEGPAWLCAQEDGPIRGGILIDEMVMGKTLQAITVILAHPSREWRAQARAAGKAAGKVAPIEVLPQLVRKRRQTTRLLDYYTILRYYDTTLFTSLHPRRAPRQLV
jgi:SNF2 family DNA or RNA helicase